MVRNQGNFYFWKDNSKMIPWNKKSFYLNLYPQRNQKAKQKKFACEERENDKFKQNLLDLQIKIKI